VGEGPLGPEDASDSSLRWCIRYMRYATADLLRGRYARGLRLRDDSVKTRNRMPSALVVVALVATLLSAVPGPSAAALFGLFEPSSPPPSSPAPVAAPDPGGQDSPDQPVPFGEKLFGFNSSLYLSDVVSTPEQELDPADLAGATAHRFGISWAGFQPRREDPLDGPNGYREKVDLLYSAALSRGITPIFVFGRAPLWATRFRSCGFLDSRCREVAESDLPIPPDPYHVDEFEAFARAVKARWPQALLEPWNEPNLYWKHPSYEGSAAFAAEPELFARMQCAVYRASKLVNSDHPVLSTGWAMTANFAEYAGRVYAAGAQRCWDVGNFHPYAGNYPSFGAGTPLAKLFGRYNTIRTKYGDTDPIWVTETGYSNTGDRAVDEQTQAELSGRLYNKLVTMPDVNAVFFHTLRDPPRNGDGAWFGYGFHRVNGSPKPVYDLFVRRALG
jgi:hypothetical protein